MQKKTQGFLTGNNLKLIAAAAMLCDHVGLMFFPQVIGLRILGRLAFPIFAYMIAEGCRYTGCRRRYFGQLFALATACQIVYFIADGSLYLSVLFTFSCSIAVIFALQNLKKELALPDGKTLRGAAVFGLSVLTVWLLNRFLTIDYGFWGCMVPVFAAAFQNRRGEKEMYPQLDKPWIHVLSTAVGLCLLAFDLGGIQFWSLGALPLLLCYSGRRGRGKMKYFFYIFYPLHLALLQVLQWTL